MPRILFALASVLSLLAIALPSSAAAAVSNDDFASATVIDPSQSSFTDSVDISQVSTESGEPQYCSYAARTVWYAITPSTDEALRVNAAGSGFYDTEINVYRQDGSDISGLTFLNCASYYGNGMTLNIAAGKTYYIQAGAMFSGFGNLQLNVQQITPPPNDNFANATPVTSVPYSDYQDTSAATIENNEPTPSCGYGQSAGTVWYTFIPSASGSYSASSPWNGFSTQLAVYKGSSVGSLTQVGCQAFGSLLTFHADAGSTYYIQVGGVFGSRGSVRFTIDVAPNPVAQWAYSPSDPSILDSVQFYDQSYDPGGLGISSESWIFGDGGAATGAYPTHRFAVDGDYNVKLTVTTPDGRTASRTLMIHVQTHDVSIAKFTVPQSAASGQTRSISVGIADTRYPETVQVQLFKNDVLIGTLTEQVPVRGGGRTTTFGSAYTFTSDDAALGKVTFKAVASIAGARDAQPSDNTAIALPTNVNG
jgi:PKD domain